MQRCDAWVKQLYRLSAFERRPKHRATMDQAQFLLRCFLQLHINLVVFFFIHHLNLEIIYHCIHRQNRHERSHSSSRHWW